ncbi:MAG TPA: ATP-binding protein [Ktedonobacterales bacterium]|nr:ATP-binding protein [Ktedonobacterales bacterium]
MRPPSPPLPPRRSPAGGDQPSQPSGANYPSAQRGMEGTLTPDFFAEALDAAMALVHADSGELATLDDTRQRLVLRARRTHPMIDPAISGFSSKGPMGAPSRPSQPLTGHETPASIEQQSTELLPGVLLTRMYRPGERLIGFTWQRGEPVIMRGEDCRELPGGTAPADTDAPWHLAVPIRRPGSFLGSPASRPIIGMIAVHNRDPLWSFSPRDVELLMLHADRVAGSMLAAEMTHLREGQSALLEMLRGEGSDHDEGLPALYVRVRDLVRQMFPAPSFALVNYQPEENRLAFALAERDEQPVAAPPLALEAAPRWWGAVRTGRAICISAPEDRAAFPEFCVLGWGGAEPVQSLLAAPLMLGKQLLGAIVAGSPNADTYAPEAERLMESVGQSAAVLIEHTRLEDARNRSMKQAQSRATQLAVLNDAVMTLNQSLDLGDTLERLEGQASGLTTRQQVCRVFLLDDAGQALVARATPGGQPGAAPADAEEEVRIPLDWRDLGKGLEGESFLVLTDLDAEWGAPTALGRMLSAGRVREALIIPVVREKDEAERSSDPERAEAPPETLGALWVYTPDQRYYVHSEEIGLLMGLAGQAAVAVHNARQYSKLAQAYERQKELDRYKDEFILTVSHEFRTPLTAIDGYVSLISRHGERLEHTKLATFATEIRQASNQLASMINMLADANRMASEPMNLTLRPVRLEECVAMARGRQPPEAVDRVQLDVPADLWVNADADRLTMVLSNLLSNALKYSPTSQACAVNAASEPREALARTLERAAERLGQPRPRPLGPAERWVMVSVSDRGEGISPDDQRKLFQRFVRLSRSLTTPVRGTGLGLWISRRYVEAMGGEIWVESVVRQGSAFRFCLPAAPAAPATS